MPLKHMYNEAFLLKILGLLDFYTSSALTSPSALAFIHQIADPRKLNVLVKLLVGGVSRGKTLVLRILQDLMKLDFPTEIFDGAIRISQKKIAEGSLTAESIDERLVGLLTSESSLDL